eukprot:3413849-Rhodomonas_salina.1
MLLQHRERDALGQRVRHIVHTGHLVQFEHSIVHELANTVTARVDVSAPFPIDYQWVISHYDAAALSSQTRVGGSWRRPTPSRRARRCYLHRALRRNELRLAGAEGHTTLPLLLPGHGGPHSSPSRSRSPTCACPGQRQSRYPPTPLRLCLGLLWDLWRVAGAFGATG